MKTVVTTVIAMVKQSPFQQDLFDFKYIEDQVATIKASMDNKEDKLENNSDDSLDNNDPEQNIYEMLHVQKLLLEDIQAQLSELNDQSKGKWWKF